jgi:Protein of unknown function (DUF4054)
MGAGPIAFNYDLWVARYPEFLNVTVELAEMYFAEACLYVDNTGMGPINDPKTLKLILNMATAHVCALNSPKLGDQFNSNGQDYNPLVGRIANASEGSVSVSTDLQVEAGTPAWWMQTKYGLAAWQAQIPFRIIRYFPSLIRRRFNPPIGRGYGF